MSPSASAKTALTYLADDEPFSFDAIQTSAIAPDQKLCFVCLRWTTDAPECRGEFHGCDLQPVTES